MNEKDLLHAQTLQEQAQAVLDARNGTTVMGRRVIRDAQRLLALAVAVVAAEPEDQQAAINGLEEFLR